MERLRNAIWHLGPGLTMTSVLNQGLERTVSKLEAKNGGKPFPPRSGEVLEAPVKPKKRSGGLPR